MNDASRYLTAQAAMLNALSYLMGDGYKPTHAVAGLANALRHIGVRESELRQALAGVLCIAPDGKMLPAANAHADVDHAHALMSMPVGQVSRGGEG